MIRGLSQNDIASRMGAHQPQVSAWLSGRMIPKDDNLFRLAEALGMAPDQVMAMIIRRRQARLAGESTG
jgi:transcriptional regulator with XRE-family HTH domain